MSSIRWIRFGEGDKVLGQVHETGERLARRHCVAVIGASQCSPRLAHLAEEVGEGIANLPADLVCGGLGGVMEAAARGARRGGARTIGLLPGIHKEAANPFIDIVLPTGLGQARNVLVVLAADVVVAVGGELGTLSEISLALKHGIPVVGVETWPLEGLLEEQSVPFYQAHHPQEALRIVRQWLTSGLPPRGVRGAEAT